MKKRLNLFLIVILLIVSFGCKEKTRSPEELLADFIRAQKNFEYRNFEVSGTGKLPEQTLRIVGDSNGNSADLYLNLTSGDESIVKLDYMAGELYLEKNDRAVTADDEQTTALKECLAEIYGNTADFDHLAEGISSFGDISVTEQEEQLVYGFTVPAGAFPVKMKSLLELLLSLSGAREYPEAVNYRLQVTADKTGLIRKLQLDDENQFSLDLNIDRYGGSTAVKHNVLVPHKYGKLTVYSGHEYRETQVKGANYALTNDETYLELMLYPRAEVDKMGWAGYLKEYGARYYDASDVESYQLIKEEKNRVYYSYKNTAGHGIMLGLYDTPEGFYTLMCIADYSHLDQYESRFMRYLENVRW